MFKLSLTITVFIILTGCSALYQPMPEPSNLGNNVMAGSTASLTQTLITPNSTEHSSCSYPSTDILSQQSEPGVINVPNVAGATQDPMSKEGDGHEWAGPSSGALLPHELELRLCELSSNFSLKKKIVLRSYGKTLRIIQDVTLAEMKNTKLAISKPLPLTLGNDSGSAAPMLVSSSAKIGAIPKGNSGETMSASVCGISGYYVGTDIVCSD